MNLFNDSDEEGHEGMFLVFGWWALKLVNSELSVFIFRKQNVASSWKTVVYARVLKA